AIVQHRGAGDRHLGRAFRVGLEEFKMRDLGMLPRAKFAFYKRGLRLRLHAGKLDALRGPDHFHAVESRKKIEMPVGAPELAVGDRAKTDFLLFGDELLY